MCHRLVGDPFEVAQPEEIFEYYRGRGFTLVKLKTSAGWSDNKEFVFQKYGE